MRLVRILKVLVPTCALLAFAACSTAPREEPPVAVNKAQLGVFKPIPAVMDSPGNPLTEEKIALGRMLYYETRLSKGHDISCNTCHNLQQYGAEPEPTSTGHKGMKGNRNSPTVYNAAGHIAQFWDGRAKDVEEQAKGPVLNPVEMAMPADRQVIAVLKSMPGYLDAFKKAFPGEKEPVTFDNMARAIGAFERKLVTPSRWDKFLQGDDGALTNAEKAGLNEYLETGCQVCHNGTYLGGAMYQKLGLVKAWPEAKDLGRFGVTKQEADRLMFKVPSLRNIEKTGPYYHDGGIATLEDAVKEMAEYQLGKRLTDAEVGSIVTFLKALTGEIPKDYIAEPKLPPSTDKTPKPSKA